MVWNTVPYYYQDFEYFQLLLTRIFCSTDRMSIPVLSIGKIKDALSQYQAGAAQSQNSSILSPTLAALRQGAVAATEFEIDAFDIFIPF